VLDELKKIAFIPIAFIAAFVAWRGLGGAPETDADSRSAPPSVTAPQTQKSGPPQPIADRRPPQAQAQEPIEDRVHALATSGTPDQYLETFQAIERCLQLERAKELANTNIHIMKTDGGTEVALETTAVGDQELANIRKSCSTMTGRTRLDRFALLKYALDHHAAGAIAISIAEGPEGDQNALRDRPADPQVVEWRKDALDRLKTGVESGYIDALLYSTTGFHLLGAEPSWPDMYTVQLAANKIIGEINHNDGPYSKEILQDSAQALSQQQKDGALAHAQQIYLNWKQRNHG
jgi:hypothetical protein